MDLQAESWVQLLENARCTQVEPLEKLSKQRAMRQGLQLLKHSNFLKGCEEGTVQSGS